MTAPVCHCYVRDLTDEVRFGLRYGAHNPWCPVYRPSRDPVDRVEDTCYRIRTEVRTPLQERYEQEIRAWMGALVPDAWWPLRDLQVISLAAHMAEGDPDSGLVHELAGALGGIVAFSTVASLHRLPADLLNQAKAVLARFEAFENSGGTGGKGTR